MGECKDPFPFGCFGLETGLDQVHEDSIRAGVPVLGHAVPAIGGGPILGILAVKPVPAAGRRHLEEIALLAVEIDPKLEGMPSAQPSHGVGKLIEDHGMAAYNTIDAVRAAEFWLYFPNQLLQRDLA